MFDEEAYRKKLDRFNASENYRVDMEHAHRVMSGLCFGSLLDVGCGTGYFMDEAGRRFPRATIAGVDAHDWGAAPCMIADIGSEHFRAGRTYDLVTMVHSVNHIGDLETAIANIGDLLSDGGHLLVLNPNPAFVRLIQVLNQYDLLHTAGGDPTVVAYRSAEDIVPLAVRSSLALLHREPYGARIEMQVCGRAVSVHERECAVFAKASAAASAAAARPSHRDPLCSTRRPLPWEDMEANEASTR